MPHPFVISTHDLDRRAGSMRQLQVTVVAQQPLGNEVIAVAAGSPIDLDLRLEAVSEGVLVTGTVSAVAVGECVRCLGEVSEQIQTDVTELYTYPGSRHERHVEEDAEAELLPELDGDLADLEAAVTDALVPALPFQPLCTPECEGLCPVCGVRLAETEPGHEHVQLDPRWAALAGLASNNADDDEVGGNG